MQFYNTMSRKKKPSTPVRKRSGRLPADQAYVLSHIDARSAMAFGDLVRLLRLKG